MEADQKNIFSPAQERYLGDAITEQLEKDFRVIQDEDLTAYLTGVGQRVARYLPNAGIEYQFFLVDIPIVQAFAMPGGRIYVTRKLVAQAQNEDEIAGLLGHEMGHVVARQTAVDWTRYFQKVLKVSSLGDRADVYEKYHQLIENIARNPKAFRESRKERHRGQVAADLIALYAEMQAGYDAEGYIQFFDRIAGTEGKTGNWFTDFFGGTKPQSKRLRAMKKQIQEIPDVCRGTRTGVSQESFQTWKSKVIAYSGLGYKEELYGVVRKRVLGQPLRPDLTHLRFSPDGRYVLAQDDAGIFVLTQESLALLFHIEAPEAKPAQFTPDSRQIIVYNSALRVERWDVEEEKRVEVFELNLRADCLQTALSLEGRFLSCLDTTGDLSLLEVSSQKELYRKKRFHQPSFLTLFFIALRSGNLNDLQLVQMRFSPDQRYFLAGSQRNQVMFDLENLAAVKPPKKLKKWLRESFVFLDPGRIVGVNSKEPGKSAIVAFPSGEEIKEVRLGSQRLSPVAKGDYILLRPIKGGAVGVVDLQVNKLIVGNKKAAFDVFDGTFVSEDKTGLVGLYQLDAEGVLQILGKGKVSLPQSPLVALRAVALDEQFRWLALSQRSRGGVWNLQDGKRYVKVRGFRGAWVQGDGKLYAQFSKLEEEDHGIYEINSLQNQATLSFKIEEKGVQQIGKFLLKKGPADPDKKKQKFGQDIILEIQNAKTGDTLWKKHFSKEAPSIYIKPYLNSMVLKWGIREKAAKEIIKQNPTLHAQRKSLKEKKWAYLLQILNLSTGQILGSMVVGTGKGSFRINAVVAVGNWIAVSDNQNRVLLYSLTTGKMLGRVFGDSPEISGKKSLLCVESGRGKLTLYDLKTLEKKGQFVFSHPVSLMRFSEDGERLFVLTANQMTYLLDLSAEPSEVARQ